jgi:hypothetical protein
MKKTYFHDREHVSEKKVQKKTIPSQHINQKRIVDINKLLNRVRMNKKDETKRKIIFNILAIFGLSLFGLFLAIVN